MLLHSPCLACFSSLPCYNLSPLPEAKTPFPLSSLPWYISRSANPTLGYSGAKCAHAYTRCTKLTSVCFPLLICLQPA